MLKRNEHLRVGVIGCGHWGPNHIRVFTQLDRSCVPLFADANTSRLAQVARNFPGSRAVRDYHELLDDPAIHAVVVATPTQTHFAIAADALAAGKHVLVEKPICPTVAKAKELIERAGRAQRVLMVGHVFVFNSGIIRLRQLIEAGELGDIQYLDAVRTNLGPVRGDVNALYDLGTHDISIFNFLLDAPAVAVSAQGSCITQERIEDVCFATLRYPGRTLAHLHVSWLNPRKVRTITVVGSKKMAHWDDISPEETVRVYDKGMAEPPYYNSFGEFQYALRNADVHLPAIRRSEPLLEQARAFAEWVLDGRSARAGGTDGLSVVATLEAATRSLQTGGATCLVGLRDRTVDRVALRTPSGPDPLSAGAGFAESRMSKPRNVFSDAPKPG
jgi:predicted dehydrogenase